MMSVATIAGCGDDEPAPADPSRLEAVGDVLCEIQATDGSVFDGSAVVVLEDC